jgi:hypothetical protein
MVTYCFKGLTEVGMGREAEHGDAGPHNAYSGEENVTNCSSLPADMRGGVNGERGADTDQ